MPIVYLHEVKVVREQISGDRLETALNSRPPRQLMSEKEVSARSQVKIGKKFIAKVRKPKVRARHYYVKLYPRDLEEPQYRFVGKLVAQDEKEFVLEDQDGGLYHLRYAKL